MPSKKDDLIQSLRLTMLNQATKLQEANRDLARVEKASADAQLEAHNFRNQRDVLMRALNDAQRLNDSLWRKIRDCKCGKEQGNA